MKKIIYLIIAVFMFGCKSQSSVKHTNTAPQFVAVLPHVFIYKTKHDYKNNVPVLLSEDKTQIVSYPHPTDLIIGGNLALPLQLQNGYLLDNRGINKNVAFLKYTYQEYSNFKSAPKLEELYKNIIDKDPLTELYDCGKKASFVDLKKQINEIIANKQLAEKFIKIK